MSPIRLIMSAFALFFACSPGSAFAASPQRQAGAAGLPHGSAIGRYQRASIERLLAGAPASVESLSVCVFRASFADTNIAGTRDSVYFANELRHLAEYYRGASVNRFKVRGTLVPGVVKLSRPQAYYGDDDLWKERMAEMLIELVAKTDAMIDFSRYDAFAVIHADAGQETDFNNDSPYQLWSGFVNPEEMAAALKDTLGTPGVPTNDSIDGETFHIDNLMVWPEDISQDGYTFGSLGIYAYQLALRIGMIPLFDSTPGSFPNSQGVGMFDLTSYGLYNAAGFVPALPSAFNRYLMGWVEPITVDTGCSVRLVDINSASPGDTSLIKIPINSSEYYLVENRVHDTNFNGTFDFIDINGNGIPENEDTLRGAEFDFFLTETSDLREGGKRLTGSGIMVWHVDESAIRTAIASGANPNDDASWKGVDLEEADHVQDLDTPGGQYAFGSFYDSYRKGNNDRFAADTDPSSMTNAGAPTGIELAEISEAAHVMSLAVHFDPPMDFARAECPGNAAGLGVVPADLDGNGVEELVVAADTGRIYVVREAGGADWTGSVEKMVDVGGARWTAPPVLVDIDGDGAREIFVTSRDGNLYAFEPTGAPLPIDDDGTPGILKLRGDRAASPIAYEIDGDPAPELVVFSSTAGNVYMMVLGSSVSLPDTGWVHRGILGAERHFSGGRIASHPVLGSYYPFSGKRMGIYIAVYVNTRELWFLWIGIDSHGLRLDDEVWREHNVDEADDLFAFASGDVGRDSSDCLVVFVPGRGLHFRELGAAGKLGAALLRGENPSSPVLADMDGDGTLETALRDSEYLYLFSGFGASVSGWPVRIPESIVERDRSTACAPPVMGDINGDGRPEIVFRVGGDLRAYDFSGRELDGWPLPGEGFSDNSPALLKGEGGDLYVFDSSTFLPYSVDTSLGGTAGEAVVSLRRFDPNAAYPGAQAWPCWRHDAGGSSQQVRSAGASPREARIDPSTFIIYPNPAMGERVTIRVLISAPAVVTVEILTIEGERVWSSRRSHQWFQGSAVPFEDVVGTQRLESGVYLCRLDVVGDGWSWSGCKKFAVTR